MATGRKLLSITQIPNMIGIVSPIIITFLLFLGGGNGMNLLPGIGWIVSLIVMFFILIGVKSILGPKMEMMRRNPENKFNSMNAVCGLFNIPGQDNDLNYLPSERMVFHWFTIAYLAIHLFTQSGLDEGEIIVPSIFFGVIALLVVLDIGRLRSAKCFYPKLMDYIVSVFLGGSLGVGLAFATAAISENLVFFKKKSLLMRCKDGSCKKEATLQNLV